MNQHRDHGKSVFPEFVREAVERARARGFREALEAAAAEAFAEAHHVGTEDPAWQANAHAANAIGKRIQSLQPFPPPELIKGAVLDPVTGDFVYPDRDVIKVVQRLRLRPGDVLVVQTKRTVSMADYQRLRAAWEEVLRSTGVPNLRVVIVENMDLAVINVGGSHER